MAGGLAVDVVELHPASGEGRPAAPDDGRAHRTRVLYTFWVGCAFIVYFAWDRFRNRRTDADTFTFRVMQEVEVAQLGGNGALLRARLLYVVTMLSLYVAMTFFGKLIFQTLNSFDLAGIRVETSSLQFQSPQWPLLLAFGFAGLAPLVLPLRVAEDWLFRRAYRAVGIPVRILQTTRNLIDILDDYANRAARGLAPTATPAADGIAAAETDAKGSAVGGKAGTARAGAALAAELERTCDYLKERLKDAWILDSLARKAKETRTVALLAELMLLVDWAKGGRGAWPGPEVADAVRLLEADLAKQGEKLLDDFLDQLGPTTGATAEKVARRKERLEKTIAEALVLRDELLAVLGVCRARSHLCRQVGSRDGRRENRRQCHA